MVYILIKLKCVVSGITQDGFTSFDEKEHLIRFQDKKLTHLFEVGDSIQISIENIEQKGKDINDEKYSVIYCLLKNYTSNSIQCVDFENQKKGILWNYRVILRAPFFEKQDPWERNSIMKITIMKL